ncbi:MAG TPA: glutamate-1-semialdehyde 2,1-aminomutase [Methanocorpusculum sp.]|nr:glutamate-1-semialdehyde 2,1-aminomutase [Methanocorpusculum sp.]
MRSKELFSDAQKVLAGGVNSPVRAISPHPFYVKSAKGAVLNTEDGDELIDCCMGYGPLLLGHAPEEIAHEVEHQLERGWLFGSPTEAEIELAKLIAADYPSIDAVRFVSTGCEATMTALRLARGVTGKSDIVKIEGGFHGAHDSVLIEAGSGALSCGIPNSAGVLDDTAKHTMQVPFNDADALEDCLSKHADTACLIMEPVMGNIGPILPEKGYLEDVREITKSHDVLLIFDEVITGYRLGLSGAQGKFGVTPDITTLGKIAAGGFPIGVIGANREIMSLLAPEGPVYNAGTFNANPVSMAAGLAVNKYLHAHEDMYAKVEAQVAKIRDSVPESAKGTFVSCGSMFKYFYRATAPKNYREAKECDTAAFRDFFERALGIGVFVPPSQFETNFLSFAHDDAAVAKICRAYRFV